MKIRRDKTPDREMYLSEELRLGRLNQQMYAIGELTRLQKEIRSKEQSWTKQEAVLRQEIELLKLRIEEYEERECAQKKMFDKLVESLQGND